MSLLFRDGSPFRRSATRPYILAGDLSIEGDHLVMVPTYVGCYCRGENWKGNKILSGERHLESLLLERQNLSRHWVVASSAPGRGSYLSFSPLPPVISFSIWWVSERPGMVLTPVEGCDWRGGVTQPCLPSVGLRITWYCRKFKFPSSGFLIHYIKRKLRNLHLIYF